VIAAKSLLWQWLQRSYDQVTGTSEQQVLVSRFSGIVLMRCCIWRSSIALLLYLADLFFEHR
jgi:hypothetical protein